MAILLEIGNTVRIQSCTGCVNQFVLQHKFCFYLAGCSAAIRLLLRRSIHGLVILLGISGAALFLLIL